MSFAVPLLNLIIGVNLFDGKSSFGEYPGEKMRLIDEFLQGSPTTTLFHYTSARGMLGILDTGNIYASSAYHLNGSMEFRYAIELMVEQVRARLNSERGPWNAIYGQLLDQLPSTVQDAQVFVVSFSEEGDLLSQWMAYSGPSNGFALGLSPEHFEAARTAGFRLVRCVYDRTRQVELASAAIDAICQSGTLLDEEAIDKILITAAALKHPGFFREAEWRLIKPLVLASSESGGILFREGRLGLVPYLNAPLVLDSGKLVPSAIHIGPSGDATATAAAINALLYARGLKRFLGGSRVKVVPSSTPYRP
jgi:hypothetical protein